MTTITLQVILTLYFLAMVVGDLVLLAKERKRAAALSGDSNDDKGPSGHSRRHRSSRSRRLPFHFTLHVVLAAMAIIATLNSIENYRERTAKPKDQQTETQDASNRQAVGS